MFTVYCCYAVALFYGSWRVSTGAYTGGQVINVILAVIMGGFSLGSVRPAGWGCTGGCHP